MTIPFTYLIGWSKLDRWYYGVRYAKDCKPSDLWTTYFTSSQNVKDFIKIHGAPDIIQIRKIFILPEKARLHEHKVLVRLKAKKNIKFLNSHDMVGFPILTGDLNPSKRNDVREKLRVSKLGTKQNEYSLNKMKKTKTKKNLITFLWDRNKVIPQKGKIKQIKRYIEFLDSLEKNHILLKKWFLEYLKKCEAILPKPYPKNRKVTKRGRMESISISKTGTKWYHNPLTLETKPFRIHDVPEGWVLGMIKNTPNNSSNPKTKQKLSISQSQSRKNETDFQKQKRLEKYHETIRARRESKKCKTDRIS